MTDDELVTVSQFIDLRDILITVMAITSLRRLMEFGEFRLSEVAEKEKRIDHDTEQFECWVFRISRHKTAVQGPSLIFLSEIEGKAFDAYLKYYRPLVASCKEPNCFVFPNRFAESVTSCCTKMSYSSLSKAVSKTGRKAGVSTAITSRILRRSQITALWEKNLDPTWRNKIAEQCCHSLQTARRYYEFSSKVGTGKEVVDTLRKMRSEALESGTSQASTNLSESAHTLELSSGAQISQTEEDPGISEEPSVIQTEDPDDPPPTNTGMGERHTQEEGQVSYHQQTQELVEENAKPPSIRSNDPLVAGLSVGMQCIYVLRSHKID
ncbi:uncharacterized protein LOC123512284 [Portunus trituberculatus]|uniref:uncharacterized protein LOC123512284 n=1 Tax=Portunus trituberculatus TaxID=210409 RepID=UPI001E1CE65B|nr:uncharacterized protein LOC123512284 [Portunus trituberculatus]